MTLLEAALRYAAWGIPVFPLRPRTKEPATEHGVKDATTNPDRIKAWWSENPAYNIALAPGDFCFLEFDQKPWLPAWAKELGQEKPITRTHISGGKHSPHYIFKATEISKITGNVNGVRDGKEWFSFRAVNRYVLAPPSIHDETGHEYSTLTDIEPMPIPDWLVYKIAASGVSEAQFSKDMPEVDEDFDFYDFLHWTEADYGTEDGAWYPLKECPFVGRRHQGQGVRGCALFFDGASLGFKCQAQNCPSNTDRREGQSGISFFIEWFAQENGEYDGVIWPEIEIDEADTEEEPLVFDAVGEVVKPEIEQPKPVKGVPILTAPNATPRTEGFVFTDYGNADRLKWRYGIDLKFTPGLGWLVWDGKRWKQSDAKKHELVMQFGMDTIRRIEEEIVLIVHEKVPAGEEDPDGKRQKEMDDAYKAKVRAVFDWCEASQMGSHTDKMIDYTASYKGVAANVDQFDSNDWLLNTVGGAVDLKTGEVRPGERRDMMTKIVPTHLDMDAKCPLWEKFMLEVMEDKPHMVAFLQRALGYSLTGSTRERKMFILWGGGTNGKSLMLEVIKEVLGNDYAQTMDFVTLVATKEVKQGATPEMASMQGARFISASENEKKHDLAEAKVKQLTGGDRIRVRKLYHAPFDFLPTAKIWLATNYKPGITGTDDAIWNRVSLIPFNVSFKGREDLGLKEKLLAERAGILAWIVRGVLAYNEEGLNEPEEVKMAVQDYRADEDLLVRWKTENCETGGDYKGKASDLWGDYERWCRQVGEPSGNQKDFADNLKRHQIVRLPRTAQGYFYDKIRLRSLAGELSADKMVENIEAIGGEAV